jgi:hypothetical protein
MVSPSLETDKSPVSCEADAMSVMAITCGCDELVLVRFVDTSKLPSTLALMEVHLTPEQQRQLGEFASHRGRDAGALAGSYQPLSRRGSSLYRSRQAWRRSPGSRRLSHARAGGEADRPAFPAQIRIEVHWSTPAAEDLERIFSRLRKIILPPLGKQ